MPSTGSNWRAYSPEEEIIRNNGKFLQSRETDYDSDAWLDYGKMQKTDQGYSIGDGAEMEYEPSEQQRRVFDSLKRHAIMNQELRNSRFQNGGTVRKKLISKAKGGLKTPYKSELGYTQDRGGGVQYVHRVYPENDSYYIDVQYNDESLYPNRAKKFIYNPTGADFNYDEYDYSKTVPAKRYDYYKETSPGNYETIKEGQYEFFDTNGHINPNITGGQQVEYLRQLNMPLVEPKLGVGNLPRGYRGQRIYNQ